VTTLTPMVTAVVNAADFKSEAFSPGAWISILGQNLGGAETATAANTRALGGAAVSVCGIPAILSYNSGPVAANDSTGWQINALIPDEVKGQSTCPVVVTVDGQPAPAVYVAIVAGILEIFQFSASGRLLPVVTHADYSLVGPESAGFTPARPHEVITAWATGDCAIPDILIDDSRAAVSFAGRVGPGLCQINFAAPDLPSGAAQFRVSTSPNLYTLWISR